MTQPKNSSRVLVGISTFNRADILPEAIQSALDQSYPLLKVAIVDDASTDATPVIKRAFPQVEWTRWDRNQGYAPARNHLMLGADADYYVSLDDDAWFLRGDEIAIAVDILDKDPSIAAVAFDILSPDRPEVAARAPMVPSAMFIGCGHVLRLNVVRRMNGYASFPGSYGGEEKDLCLRLMDSGHRIVKLPGVHVWHDKTPTARDLEAQHRSGVCNDLTIMLRRTPLLLVPAAVGWKVLRHYQFSRKAGLLGPYWAGIRAFLHLLPSVLRGRRPVKWSTLRLAARLNKA